MLFGHVRDRFPRVSLNLPGHEGFLSVEFIVDTGLDGDLALPASLIAKLEATPSDTRRVQLADGSQLERPYYQLLLNWEDEDRLVEVLSLENPPLLGVGLLEGYLLQAEMQDGGEVSLESL